MRKFKIKLLFFLLFVVSISQAQTEIKGTIKDIITNETLIGASVIYAEGKGTVTDIDGNFKLNLPNGDYTLIVSYIGYEAQTKKIKLNGQPITINFSLELKGKLDEVEIVADVAKNRETPVAFSNIDQKKITEELGARDLPMLLNSTPGVYATEQGGGAGDARINVRGFDQRNVAVMVDGVPFNDMETGAVFWSNWNGIGGITRSMQIQRGLGASKLAIASVGGTINILTKGIDNKPGGQFKQTIGNNGLTQTSFGYNAVTKNGFGLTFNFMYGQGNGLIEQTWNKSFSYFMKVQKRYKNHLVSLGINGATQSHGQRPGVSFSKPMFYYDAEYSKKNGINTDSLYTVSPNIVARGINYNYNWGYYYDKNGNKKIVNENTNYYHKPVFNLSDFWSINDKLYWSNTAYLSVGKGGGTVIQNIPTIFYPDGQENYQNSYNSNITPSANNYTNYGTTDNLATTYARSSVNNHIWYGLLSVLNYKIDKKWSSQLGFDGRIYNGSHWQTPTDLLGGDFVTDKSDNTQPYGGGNQQFSIKRVGDKMGYYYKSNIRWAGLFGQLERKTEKFTMFLNVTGNYSMYKRIDYFAKKDLVLDDTTYYTALGYTDTIKRNGNVYTINSPQARTATTEWKNFLTYTIKAGANYNVNEHNSVFLNLGYLVLPPKFVNVYDRNNHLFTDIQNQYVKAIEIGYGLRYSKFATNLNAYYTIWQNKPPDFSTSIKDADGNTFYYNINGMDALHKGVELDFSYKLLEKLTIDGVVSIGDWKYTSTKQYTILDVNGSPADSLPGVPFAPRSFDAKNVHVSNAAQIQYVLSAKYFIIKGLFIKPRYTYFAKNYSNFDPVNLVGVNAGRDSWKIPSYGLVDLFAGYDFKLTKKTKLMFNLGIINLLNTVYISDAQNNGASTLYYGGFNAYSANVYFGQGRRWTLSASLNF